MMEFTSPLAEALTLPKALEEVNTISRIYGGETCLSIRQCAGSAVVPFQDGPRSAPSFTTRWECVVFQSLKN